jgi:hypothetical protein
MSDPGYTPRPIQIAPRAPDLSKPSAQASATHPPSQAHAPSQPPHYAAPPVVVEVYEEPSLVDSLIMGAAVDFVADAVIDAFTPDVVVYDACDGFDIGGGFGGDDGWLEVV